MSLALRGQSVQLKVHKPHQPQIRLVEPPYPRYSNLAETFELGLSDGEAGQEPRITHAVTPGGLTYSKGYQIGRQRWAFGIGEVMGRDGDDFRMPGFIEEEFRPEVRAGYTQGFAAFQDRIAQMANEAADQEEIEAQWAAAERRLAYKFDDRDAWPGGVD